MTNSKNEPIEEEFQAIEDVAHRWTLTLEDAEAFLENNGYFKSIRGGKVR